MWEKVPGATHNATMNANTGLGRGERGDEGERGGERGRRDERGRGGEEGEMKRRERAARKLAEQASEDEQREDDLSMWELKYSFENPVGDIRITEDWSGEGNGIAGLQWLGGVVISRYMDSRQVFPEEHFVGRRIIEVGAGCGLTSIYAALRGADVTITDMDVDKCVENVEANLGPRGLSGKACVRRLEWGSTEDLALFEPPYDVVIAGDCLYEEACIAPLLQTMWALAGPETEIFLCGVVGHGILQRFLSQVDSYFHREVVDTSKIDTLAAVHVETGGSLSAADSNSNSAEAGVSGDAAQLEDDKRGRASLGAAGAAGAEGARRPGQRALLRLRKKCAEQGQSIKEGLLCATEGGPGPVVAIC